VSFGGTAGEGSEVLAAAVAGLALGLLPYSAFLLLARGSYALGDSRTPGLVSVAGALVGVAVMVAGSLTASGTALVFVLGLGHTAAYLLGVAVLGVGLARRTGTSLRPAALGRVLAVGATVGLAVWAASGALLGDDPSRLADAAVVAGLGLAGAGAVLVAYRLLGVPAALSTRTPVPAPTGASGATPEVVA
jgi:putative peptidoglycan lipid II flippase